MSTTTDPVANMAKDGSEQTSSFSVEQAAHQNADGVLCLRRGDCGRAFHSFVSALTTLSKVKHQLLAAREPPPTLCQERPPSQDSRGEPPLHCSSPISTPPSPTTTHTSTSTGTPEATGRPTKNCRAISIPYLEDNGFYIYSHALVFSRRPHIGDTSFASSDNAVACLGRSPVEAAAIHRVQQQQALVASQIDTVAYCEAVAQFNLGLAYHQRGRHCGEDRTLLGALQLYVQSLATLQSIDTKSARQSKDVRVLRLAVTNNKIHILNEMACYAAAQALVNDFLLQSIQTLSASEISEASDPQSTASAEELALCFLARADIDNFLLNALVIRRYNTAPCA